MMTMRRMALLPCWYCGVLTVKKTPGGGDGRCRAFQFDPFVPAE
jgi:hypothetical protein